MILLASLLVAAMQAAPDTPQSARDLVLTGIAEATAAREGGRTDDAFIAADQAIAVARTLIPADPVLLSDALVARCDAASSRAEPDISDCHEALKLREAALPLDDPRLHNLRIQIAVHKVMDGKAVEAQAEIEAGLAGLRRHEQTPAMRTDVGMAIAVLGMAHQAQDRRREAETTYRAAIAELEAADDLGRRYRPLVYNYLNGLLLNEGRLVEALRDAETSAAIQRASAPTGDPTLIGVLGALAAAQQRAGALAAAEASLREQLALLDVQQSPQPSLRANALTGLAALYVDTGRPELARPLLETAVETYHQGGEAGRRSGTTALVRLSDLELKAGDPVSAKRLAEQALADLGQEVSSSQGRASVLTTLAAAHQDLGEYVSARESALEALDIYRRIAPGSPVISGPLLILAETEVATGRIDEAEPLLKEAVDLARSRTPTAPTRLSVENARVDLALRQDKPLDPEIVALAGQVAEGARDLLIETTRAGLSTQGVRPLTRSAFVNAIEVDWRAAGAPSGSGTR